MSAPLSDWAVVKSSMAPTDMASTDMYELPFPDASFDAALAHTVVEHLGDPLAAFSEVKRVLKAGASSGSATPTTARHATPPTAGRTES